MDVGNNRGNLYAYASVVPTSASPNGGKVLKFGFFPSPNKVFKMSSAQRRRPRRGGLLPLLAGRVGNRPRALGRLLAGRPTPFLIRQNLAPLKVGGTYTV